MITVIIASYKEKDTIGDAISAIANKEHSGIPDDFEIIQVSPDEETLLAGRSISKILGLGQRFRQVVDPLKGKSYALNMALEQAKGEIIIMTDGDVKLAPQSISNLLKAFKDPKIHGATGCPIPINDKKDGFMGYLSYLLTSVADKKRREVFNEPKDGYFTSEGAYFPMSGYLLGFRNEGYRYDPEYLDDTFISLLIVSKGHDLAYVPKAKVMAKFPTSVGDYLKQRRRNIHGTRYVHKDKRFKEIFDQRTLGKEMNYFTYPLEYASSVKEAFYSVMFYPLRMFTWFYALFPKKSGGYKTWKRIESTK